MKAFDKTVFRTIKNNVTRLIAVTFIILLGVCFVSGLGALSPKILGSFDLWMRDAQVADVIVKAAGAGGLTDEQIETVTRTKGVESVFKVTAVETEIDGMKTRICLMPLSDMPFNRLQTVEGVLPTDTDQCVVERASDTVSSVNLGEEIAFMGRTFTVGGVVANPLIFARDGERTLVDDVPLERIVYLDADRFPLPLPVTDLYVRVESAQDCSVFSKPYKTAVSNVVSRLETAVEGPAYLTLEENRSAATLESVSEKVDVISLIFPVFFILVVALVVLTTMTRLIEEERPAIGCYKTLGCSDAKVAFKYLSLALLCCLIGMTIGNVAGVYLLPAVICPAFDIMFFLPTIIDSVDLSLGLISSAAMLVAVLAVTGYVVGRELREKPAMLLKAKAPKPGKKIFLEHIPFFWKRLAFKYKSMFRNIFRYVGRLLMVVVSVAGSTALVMAGFGLKDVSPKGIEIAGVTLAGMSDSLVLIAGVVIVFAALLCVLVIYNLTNMSISERRREIATLKVLGYYDIEVGGYVYREILLMAVFGILLGIPLGAGVLSFIFHYLEFGSMASVHWYSYLLTAAVNLAAIACVDLLLYPKIRREDMNTSLKAVE